MVNWPWKSRQKEPVKRYAAARLSRYVDFFAVLQNAHRERLADLSKLRAHSRSLMADNVYAARYGGLVETNLVGPDGIHFQSEIKTPKGELREDWNTTIEEGWTTWGSCCTTDGRLSWVEAQQLLARTVAMDGEVLIRKVLGYANDCGFAIEIIDADRLDHAFNANLKGGARIVGSVELDAYGRRLAYHLWTAHPDDYEAKPQRIRIPADQIIHLYREDRTQGIRGIPWMTPAMVQLNMLGRLWTSELAAANHDADRLGIIQSLTGLDANEYSLESAESRAQELSSEIAHFMALDANQQAIFPPSQHPNSVLPGFSSFLLKGVASALGVAHHSLSGDLSESKFSSDRTGLIQERDNWRKLQGWFIRSCCDPIFQAWLEMALLSGAVRLPTSSLETLSCPKWYGRTWDWVDPAKDISASKDAISSNLSTLQQELGSRGLNWRDVLIQRQKEEAFLAKLKPTAALPASTGSGEAAGAVQDTALNGAQVASLLEIINAVAAGSLPKATAEAMIIAAFPAIDPAKVAEMLRPITPTPKKETSDGSQEPTDPVA